MLGVLVGHAGRLEHYLSLSNVDAGWVVVLLERHATVSRAPDNIEAIRALHYFCPYA
jgi:hypothetical protein